MRAEKKSRLPVVVSKALSSWNNSLGENWGGGVGSDGGSVGVSGDWGGVGGTCSVRWGGESWCGIGQRSRSNSQSWLGDSNWLSNGCVLDASLVTETGESTSGGYSNDGKEDGDLIFY